MSRLYLIKPFCPSKKSMNAWNFHIALNPDLASLLQETSKDQTLVDELNREGKRIIERITGDSDVIRDPYFFHDHSLVQAVYAPGDASALSASDVYKGWFWYNPVNIDQMDTAVCLQSLWVHWANKMSKLVGD